MCKCTHSSFKINQWFNKPTASSTIKQLLSLILYHSACCIHNSHCCHFWPVQGPPDLRRPRHERVSGGGHRRADDREGGGFIGFPDADITITQPSQTGIGPDAGGNSLPTSSFPREWCEEEEEEKKTLLKTSEGGGLSLICFGCACRQAAAASARPAASLGFPLAQRRGVNSQRGEATATATATASASVCAAVASATSVVCHTNYVNKNSTLLLICLCGVYFYCYIKIKTLKHIPMLSVFFFYSMQKLTDFLKLCYTWITTMKKTNLSYSLKSSNLLKSFILTDT